MEVEMMNEMVGTKMGVGWQRGMALNNNNG